jgi:hypothetical protein
VTCHLCPALPLVTRHLSLATALSFLGGTTNPEGVRQRTDKAEARRAASAQASFPPRRARQKAVPEKMPRIVVWGVAIVSRTLSWCWDQFLT